jgi:small subunit ribosomal protein S18e
LYLEDASTFKFILRVLNTNLDGKRQAPFAFRSIRGIGRRFAIILCQKSGIPVHTRAGELTEEQVNKITEMIADPVAFGIPTWFLNRRSDFKNKEIGQMTSTDLDSKFREDIERMKKIR